MQRIEDLLRRILVDSNRSSGPNQRQDPRQQQQSAAELIENYKKQSSHLRRQNDLYSNFTQLLKGQAAQTEDVSYKLRELDAAIASTTDQKAKQLLIEERARTKMTSAVGQTVTTAVNFAQDVGKTAVSITKDVANLVPNVLSALTTGSGNEIRAFGSILGGVTKVVGGIGEAAGKTVSGLGEAVSKIPYIGKMLAVPMQVLGTTFGALAGVFGSVAPAIISFFTEQMQKTIESFNNVNRAGAFFVGGMTEMRDTANSAGLTMESYSKVVAANAEGLKNLGGSVANGAKRFADIQRAMLPMRESLLNLGYTIDDQADGIMQYSNALFISGQLQNKTAVDLAKGAGDYLVNLRLISSITGEDAKRAQQRARDAATQAAVQAKLASMDEKSALKFQALVAVLPPELQKAAQQIFVMGTATGDAAIALAQMPSMERAIRGAIDGIGNSGQDLREYTAQTIKGIATVAPEFARQAGAAGSSIGLASLAGMGYDSVATIISATQRLGFSIQDLSKPENFEKLMKSLEGAKNTTDATTNAAANIQITMNQLQILVEQQISKLMTTFAKVLNDNIGTIQNGIERLGQILNNLPGNLTKDKLDPSKMPKPTDTTGENMGGTVGAIGGGIAGALTGKAIAGALVTGLKSAGGLLGMAPLPQAKLLGGGISLLGAGAGYLLGSDYGEKAGQATGSLYDRITGYFDNLLNARALGGPVRKGRTYLVGERGAELFTPDVDGSIVSNQDMMNQLGKMTGETSLLTKYILQSQNSFDHLYGTAFNNMNSILNNLVAGNLQRPESGKTSTADLNSFSENLLTAINNNMAYTKESGASLTSIARDIVQGQNLYQSVKSTLDSLRDTDLTGTTASQEFGDKIAAFGQKIEELLRIENKPKIDAVNNEIHSSLRDQIVIQREFVEMQREMQSVLQDLRSLQQQLLYHTT